MERMLIMCNTCMASARLRRARFIMRDNLGMVVFWNDLLKLYISKKRCKQFTRSASDVP